MGVDAIQGPVMHVRILMGSKSYVGRQTLPLICWRKASIIVLEVQRCKYGLHISQVLRRLVLCLRSALFHKFPNRANDWWVVFIIRKPPVHTRSILKQIGHLSSKCVRIYVSIRFNGSQLSASPHRMRFISRQKQTGYSETCLTGNDGTRRALRPEFHGLEQLTAGIRFHAEVSAGVGLHGESSLIFMHHVNSIPVDDGYVHHPQGTTIYNTGY